MRNDPAFFKLISFICSTFSQTFNAFGSQQRSINQSIQKVLTPRRGQHCTNNNITAVHKIQNSKQLLTIKNVVMDRKQQKTDAI